MKTQTLNNDPRRKYTIEALIDAAFTVLAHDISRNGLGDAKEAYEVQSGALRERFKAILEK